MLRSFSFFALATTFACGAASAGGYVEPTPAPPPVVVEPQEVWTEGYVGLQYDTVIEGEVLGPPPSELEGNLLGMFAGYRYDFGTFVLGGEIDYMHGEVTVLNAIPAGGIDVDMDVEILRVGAELGVDAGRALIYGTAGFARLSLEPATFFPADESNGVFYGLGADFRMTERVIAGVELLHHNFDDFGAGTPEIDITTFGVNVAFTF